MNKRYAMGSIKVWNVFHLARFENLVNFFGFDGKWCMCNVNGGMQKDIMEDFG